MKKFSVFILSFILAFSFASQPVLAMKKRKIAGPFPIQKIKKTKKTAIQPKIRKGSIWNGISDDVIIDVLFNFLGAEFVLSILFLLSKSWKDFCEHAFRTKCVSWTVPIVFSEGTNKNIVYSYIKHGREKTVSTEKSSFKYGLEFLMETSTQCFVRFVICFPLGKDDIDGLLYYFKKLEDEMCSRISEISINDYEYFEFFVSSPRGKKGTCFVKQFLSLQEKCVLKKIIIDANIFSTKSRQTAFLEALNKNVSKLEVLCIYLKNFSKKRQNVLFESPFNRLREFGLKGPCLGDFEKFCKNTKNSLKILDFRSSFSKKNVLYQALKSMSLLTNLKKLTLGLYYGTKTAVPELKKVFSELNKLEILVFHKCYLLNFDELLQSIPETVKSLTFFYFFKLRKFPEIAEKRLQNLESFSLIEVDGKRKDDYLSNEVNDTRCSKEDLIDGLLELKKLKRLKFEDSFCLVNDDLSKIRRGLQNLKEFCFTTRFYPQDGTICCDPTEMGAYYYYYKLSHWCI